MGIKAHFKGNIDATFAAFLAEVERQIIESLCRIGEEVVTLAKLVPPERGFTDRTGNLRSSIGYVVCKDGQPLNIAFEALQVAKDHTEGYTLIVVAGMNYAVYVESKGRDVLTSAEKEAEKLIARELADLITNVQQAFK